MSKVYIGVGHGGSDPGAVYGKHKEATYALDIATACTNELKRHGISVMQSRTSNVTETSAQKVKECNNYKPDVALDIHLNAGGGDGFEIFRSVAGGKGVQLAEKINTAVLAIGQNSRGIKTKTNSNGKDYFGFIRQTNCPAVLVECAFIDSKDVQIIDTLAERQKMGIAIAHGIIKYFGLAIKVATSVTSTSTTANTKKTFTVTLEQLQKGNKNAMVKSLQLLLIGKGYPCGDAGADGDFGNGTLEAVKNFQKNNKLTITGIVDQNTWNKLLKN